MDMCREFAASGEDVTFVSPRSGGRPLDWEEASDYTDSRTSSSSLLFRLFRRTDRFLPLVPNTDSQAVTYWLLWKYLSGGFERGDVLYSRNLYPTRFSLWILDELGIEKKIPVWFEQHQVDQDTNVGFYDRLDGVVCVSECMKRRLVQTRPVDATDVLVAHDSVDLEAYEGLSTESGRTQLRIDPDERIVMYTGHLYPAKDVERLVRAAREFDATCYVVGGYPEDVSRIRDEETIPENVVFTEFVPPSQIPVYQTAADLLAVTVARDLDMEYFSPLKLFEYMATGKPIVVSRKPGYEEVLTHGENALFVEPEPTAEISDAVTTLFSDPDLRADLAEQVGRDIARYGWRVRAKRILNAIDGRPRSVQREKEHALASGGRDRLSDEF